MRHTLMYFGLRRVCVERYPNDWSSRIMVRLVQKNSKSYMSRTKRKEAGGFVYCSTILQPV